MATREETHENPRGDSDRISLLQWMSQNTPLKETTLSQLTLISNSILDVLTGSSDRAKCVLLRPELIELQRRKKDGSFETFFQFDEQSDQTMETFLLIVTDLIIWAHERLVHGSKALFLGVRPIEEISHQLTVLPIQYQLKQRLIYTMPQPSQGYLRAAVANRHLVSNAQQPAPFQLYSVPPVQFQANSNMRLNLSQPPSYSDVLRGAAALEHSPNLPSSGFNTQGIISPSVEHPSLPFTTNQLPMARQLSQQFVGSSESNSEQFVSQPSLATILEDEGIESEFWMPIFKDELMVRGLQGLRKLTRLELSETLHKHARKPWEIRAILALLPEDETEQNHSNINTARDDSPLKASEEAESIDYSQVPHQCDTESEDSDNDVFHECSTEREIATKKMLCNLGLSKYYPQKLDQNTVLRWYGRELKSMADLVPVYLSRLISMDSGAREDITGKLLDDIRNVVPNTDAIHPLDVTTAVFMCANDFLRILLAEKMFVCRQSIPFLLPMQVGENDSKPILHLPLHGLIGQNSEGIESSVLTQKTRITCFMRIGTPEMSKSKLANELLKTDANMFAHQDLLDQNVQCSLSHGLVDVGWFLHNPKEDENLEVQKSVITVLNLHGNAKENMEERDILIEVSSTCFITVSLGEFCKSKSSNTLILLKMLARQAKKTLVLILSPDTNSSKGETNLTDIQATLTESLSRPGLELHVLKNYKGVKVKAKSCLEIIQKQKAKFSLQKQIQNYLNGRPGFILDEDTPACKEGRNLCNEIMTYVNEGKLQYVKNKYLPLQGDKWKEWARLNKLKHRHSGKSAAAKNNVLSDEELYIKMREIRKDQAKLTKNGMSLIIKKVLATKSSEWQISRPYFFFWLKLGFDFQSRSRLPSLRKKHEKVWQELQVHLNKPSDSPQARQLQDEFKKLDHDIAAESLGIEHIFRELSQLFEIKDETTHAEELSQLPDFMAELLLMGQPMELMDGDASHVSITWVKTVLEAVSKKINHKKVLVLSVLGIQSSGKSTLLNGLFGLKFAVSAGRCTRGVYAQLVPAPDHFKLGYDYIFVVDTEGLRAPELGNTKESVEHDHEIATFVLGLGDINIINIKGENHAEMQEILQIVIHALLRMIATNSGKGQRLRPTSIFVHQNVSAINASQQMIASQRALLNNLNEMTLAAAADLHLEYKFKQFNDLITFDVNKHAKYFSNLLKGVPPMAPTNVGYAEDVNKLKQLIFSESKTKTELLNLRYLASKLDNLWSGILKENFIFSFRNAIEVRAYGSLESILCKLTNKLQATASTETTKGAEFIQAQSMYIDRHAQTAICKIVKSLENTFLEIESELEEFLSQNKDRGVMEQWHHKSLQKLKDTKDELCRAKRKEIESIEHWTNTQITMDKKIEKYQTRLTEESKKLVHDLKLKKGSLSESELKKEFDDLWGAILNEMPQGANSIDIMSFGYAILEQGPHKIQLYYLNTYWWEVWDETGLLDICKLQEILVPKMEENFLKRGLEKMFGNKKTERMAEKLKVLLMRITQQCDSCLMSLGNDRPFHESDLIKIQQIWQESEKDLSKLMKEIREESVLERLMRGNCYVLQWAVQKLETRQTNYLQKMNLRDHFHEKNNASMYKMFKNIYHETEAQGAIDIFVLNFWKAILKHVTSKQPQAMLDVLVKEMCLETKSELQKSALKKLIQEDDFNSFFGYLKNTQKELVQYITVFSESVLFETGLFHGTSSVYSNISNLVLEETMEKVRNVFESTNGENQGNLMQTLTEIQRLLAAESQLHFPKQVFDLERYGLNCQNISIDFFKGRVIEELTSQIEEQKKVFMDTRKLPDPIAKIVYKRLEINCIGCSEQCPFCKSVCTRSISDHDCDHSCLLHYPQGLGGWRWSDSELLLAETCSYYVQSKIEFYYDPEMTKTMPYSRYKELHPEWTIIPDPEDKTSMFWQYAFAKFNKQFADKYKAKVANIPQYWHDIKMDSVLISLDHELKGK